MMALFIAWKACKYPRLSKRPMPGVTALVQVKQRPAVNPVSKIVPISISELIEYVIAVHRWLD